MKPLATALLLALLAACGSNNYDSYDDAAYAGAICTDGGNYRVPDEYCPIGDGDPPAGYAYHWAYRPYRSTDRNIDVVYVGYPVDTHVWVHQRPARVSTLHIDRGSYPTAPAAGQPRTSAAAVATEPVRATATNRGGLGAATAAPAGKVAPPPKRIPPPPAKARPMAAAKGTTRDHTPPKKRGFWS